MKISLATTTINVPTLLEDYAKDAVSLSTRQPVEFQFVVAGDRKTPSSTEYLLKSLQEKYDIPMKYISPENQLSLLDRVRPFKSYLDFDCIQRRNLAGLYCFRSGADVIVYIDDDNLIQKEGYFEAHLRALYPSQKKSLCSDNGFFNIMQSGIGERSGQWLFPRGFPFSLRNKVATTSIEEFGGRVCANAGLWTEEPDIDAVSRIAGRPIINKYLIDSSHNALSPRTWTPLNSQNTAILSEFLPTYFLSSHVGRYDDIFAGYILQRIASQMGFAVSFGDPIVRQVRNEHDLILDLKLELEGMTVLDYFLNQLRNYVLVGDTVFELIESLLYNFENTILELPRNHFAQNVFKSLHTGYSLWNNLLSLDRP